MNFKSLLILQCILLLTACTSLTQQPSDKYPNAESQSCADFFIDLEQLISTAGVKDAETARIKTYPYLRINRFLADFRNDPMTTTSFEVWLDQLQGLAEEGFKIELRNLSTADREKLSHHANKISSSNMNLNNTIEYCGDLIRSTDLDDENERDHLKTIVKVPDEYKTWQRVIGLYPLSALAFRSGINAWHKKTNKVYATPLKALAIKGELLRYAAHQTYTQLTDLQIARIIKESSQNKLHISYPSISEQKKLFDSFAPIFEIDIVSNNDRIGTVTLDKNTQAIINTDRANVYQHISHTRLSDKILLQLNYTVWFPARPETSSFDLLAGHLDGITWRVTLLPSGKPLLFDSIHNCGCYHLFFPTQYATVLPQKATLDEPVFIPQTLSISSSSHPVIRIAESTHYIERVYFDTDATRRKAISYQQTDSKELRSLALGNGEHRSLYGQDGIIDSSMRGERYLFWPMGIPNPGAMRQWGHHATAFVGRRHFDDARLFEKYFSINKNN